LFLLADFIPFSTGAGAASATVAVKVVSEEEAMVSAIEEVESALAGFLLWVAGLTSAPFLLPVPPPLRCAPVCLSTT